MAGALIMDLLLQRLSTWLPHGEAASSSERALRETAKI